MTFLGFSTFGSLLLYLSWPEAREQTRHTLKLRGSAAALIGGTASRWSSVAEITVVALTVDLVRVDYSYLARS